MHTHSLLLQTQTCSQLEIINHTNYDTSFAFNKYSQSNTMFIQKQFITVNSGKQQPGIRKSQS